MWLTPLLLAGLLLAIPDPTDICLPPALEKIQSGCFYDNSTLCLREGCFPYATVLETSHLGVQLSYRIDVFRRTYNITSPLSVYCITNTLRLTEHNGRT